MGKYGTRPQDIFGVLQKQINDLQKQVNQLKNQKSLSAPVRSIGEFPNTIPGQIAITDTDHFYFAINNGDLYQVVRGELITVSSLTIPAVTANSIQTFDVTVGSEFSGWYSLPLMITGMANALVIQRNSSQLVTSGSARVIFRNTSDSNTSTLAGQAITFLMLMP